MMELKLPKLKDVFFTSRLALLDSVIIQLLLHFYPRAQAWDCFEVQLTPDNSCLQGQLKKGSLWGV